MALLNLIALFATIIVILIDRSHPKAQLDDAEEEPLLQDPESS